MPFDAFRFKVFSRRVFIIGTLQAVAFFFIIARLFKFQVLDYSYFKSKSDGNRIKSQLIPPLRGLIYDRDGKMIASNVEYYRILLKKTNYKADLELINSVASILMLKNDGIKAMRQEYAKNKQLKEVIIYRYLTRKELLDIEFNLYKLKNISVGIGYARMYSNSYSFSNLLGYLIQVPKSDSEYSLIAQDPDIKIGAEGLEKIHNKILMGKVGARYTEVNAKGFKVEDLKTIPPIKGVDKRFAFNARIQNFAFELCKDKKASVVLLDINTGEVICMISTPSFNANSLSQKIDTQSWNELLLDPKKPLLNRPIQSAFPPGSIYKPITAIIALENGMKLDETITCTGSTYLYGRERKCWLKEGHGKNINIEKAIKHSCNILFYHIATKYDIESFYNIGAEFGIGQKFVNFEFQNQNSGINPDSKWKKKVIGERWFPGDTVNLSIGQGFVKMTAMQIAVMLARIASLGKKVEPTLEFIQNPLDVSFEDINIKKENLEIVKNSLFEATNSLGGTSYYSRIKEKGLEFSGKTGTAQVVSKFLEKDEYTDITRPHGLFGAFAPFTNPQFAIGVIVENGGFGSVVGAPIGKNILHFAQLINIGRLAEAEKLAKSLGINFKNL
jgi:penicillin-binding protein 2